MLLLVGLGLLPRLSLAHVMLLIASSLAMVVVLATAAHVGLLMGRPLPVLLPALVVSVVIGLLIVVLHSEYV